MFLRPDEEAALSAIERDKSFRGNVSKGINTGIGLAAGAGLAGLSSKIMPLLNEFIPAGLALKGINKLSPKLGQFLRNGQEMGLNLEEGFEFIKDKIGKKAEERSVIEKHSPSLFSFLKEHIGQGKSPVEAAALATLPSKSNNFKSVISKLEKENKAPWISIVQSVFGTGTQKQPNQQPQNQEPIQQPQQPQQPPQQQPQQQPQPQPQQTQQGAGPGQEALMAILQKIQATRGQ